MESAPGRRTGEATVRDMTPSNNPASQERIVLAYFHDTGTVQIVRDAGGAYFWRRIDDRGAVLALAPRRFNNIGFCIADARSRRLFIDALRPSEWLRTRGYDGLSQALPAAPRGRWT
jgi:hypothetical protein